MTTAQLVATTSSAAICAKVQDRQRADDIAAAIEDALDALKPLSHHVATIELHALILERMAEEGELPEKQPLPGWDAVCEAARAISDDDLHEVASAIQDLAELIAIMPAGWLHGGQQNLTVPTPGAPASAVRAYAEALLREDTITAATTTALLLLDDTESMAGCIVEDEKARPQALGQGAKHLRHWVSEVQGSLERLAELIGERDDR